MNSSYKFGDIIVRCYTNNFNAMCIYLDTNNGGHMMYLGDTFNHNGGLSQFDKYTLGTNEDKWDYRLANYDEVVNILNYLNSHRNINGNVVILNPINNLDNAINIVNNFKMKMRKEKLIKLNEITNT